MKAGREKDYENSRLKFLKRWHINPNLLMLKISLFVMYGATASLIPYLTIHMQSIGLTIEEISIVYMVLPFTTFISPPITGYLVDKFGQYKPVVVMSLIFNAIFHHSLLFFPLTETPGKVPFAFVLKHPAETTVEVWWSPCPSRQCPEAEELDIILAACEDYCLLPDQSSGAGSENHKAATPKTTALEDDDNKNLHILVEAEKKRKPKRIPEKAKSSKHFPHDHQFDKSAFFYLDMHPDLREPAEHLGIEVEQLNNDTTINYLRKRFGEQVLLEGRVNLTALENEDLRCGGQMFTTNLTQNTLKELAADCMLQKCRFREGGPRVCPPDYRESEDNIFWIYFLLRFFGTLMLSGGVMLLDPIALMMIQKYGGEFGRERLFSTLGMAIFSPLTGLLIDHDSRKKGYTDYAAAFYMYDALLMTSAITVMLMPLGMKLPADNVLRDLLRIMRLPHVTLFIIFLFLLGNFWGFIESFLFLYLKELGASNYLLGATITVGTISSIPFLYGAGKLTRKYGHVNIIIAAFFSHAARLIGYSFIENPWWCFPFEVIESVAVHLMWIAAATYCEILAPKKLLATLIGVLAMAHFSLGRGSGSYSGGLMIASLGTHQSFRIMGLFAISSGIAYGLLHYFWLHKVEAKYASKRASEDGCECEHFNSEVSVYPKHKDSDTSAECANLVPLENCENIGNYKFKELQALNINSNYENWLTSKIQLSIDMNCSSYLRKQLTPDELKTLEDEYKLLKAVTLTEINQSKVLPIASKAQTVKEFLCTNDNCTKILPIINTPNENNVS
ncbi:uncharacterized protein LOC134529542 [Bacillus rossius redtenbacheri]|uniref:uncharacterized protein LOC134529542 n=1 Tax=Bacillus rossius redtenbacheri TaxID=93214 RepID=UPI002FDE5F91